MRPSRCACAVLTVGLGACAGPAAVEAGDGGASLRREATTRPVSGPEPDPPQPLATEALAWTPGPPLPEARANNVVARLPGAGQPALLTLLGLAEGRTHADILSDGWSWSGAGGAWTRLPGAPHRPGRLASTAQTVGGLVFVFGGYTVAADGAEVSTPEVDAYDAASGTWATAAAMPVPVDDAVSGVWKGQVVLVSGWHDRDNVRDVQVFDPAANRWSTLPPLIGVPVFGHAGGIVGETLVYCDGVGVDRARDPVFQAVQECHAMTLGAAEPAWTVLPHHGRPTRYRAAATGWPQQGWVVFAGGTGRPYNYNGTGYDGLPAEPRAEVFAWVVASSSWIALPELPVASMDHRGLVVADEALWLIGGMRHGAEVSAEVWRLGPA